MREMTVLPQSSSSSYSYSLSNSFSVIQFGGNELGFGQLEHDLEEFVIGTRLALRIGDWN